MADRNGISHEICVLSNITLVFHNFHTLNQSQNLETIVSKIKLSQIYEIF